MLAIHSFTWIVLGVLAAFIACEVLALCKWRGVWRMLAAALGVALACVGTRIVLLDFGDPREQHLFHGWPFEVLWWSGAGLLALGTLWIVRAGSGLPSGKRDARPSSGPRQSRTT